MTEIEIVDLLKESGVWDEIGYPTCIDKLIDLVAAHGKKFWMEQIEVECNEAVLAEREACAKVCEEMWAGGYGPSAITAAIRQRGDTK